MRDVVFCSAALAALVLASRPTPAVAVSPWCYFNEEVHCTEVSFEMCHFGTLGNGGYCFPNPYYRRHFRPEPELLRGRPGYNGWYGDWWPVDYGYPDYRGHQQMIAMWPGYSWCYGLVRCGAPPFQAYPFGGHGAEGYWYGSSWYFGANYRWGPRFAHNHRLRRVPRETIASTTGNDQPGIRSAGLHEPDIGEARLALASADPQNMLNPGIASGSNEKAAMLAARKRPMNGVPAVNVVPSCRAGASIGVDQNVDVCLAQEMSARDQVARDWDQFSSADRSSCVRVATIGSGGSYTALLSCIEMKRDARNLSKENTSALMAGR